MSDETLTARCEDFLIGLFSEQSEYLASEVLGEGERKGFSDSLVKTLKAKLGIKAEKNGYQGRSYWKWNIFENPYQENSVPLENGEKQTSGNPPPAQRVQRDIRISEVSIQECPFERGRKESKTPETLTGFKGSQRDSTKTPSVPLIEDRIDKKKKRLRETYIREI